MTSQPIFRFAPSPNGWLHLGHAYSALYTDRAAKAMGGTMLLRIEDIDTARRKPEFVAGIFEDLQWLGLSWPQPVWFQSQRFPAYGEAAERLRKRGLLYPCFCSRSEISARASGTDPEGAPFYPGTCRHLTKEQVEQRLAAGERAQWRLRMDEALVAGPMKIHVFAAGMNEKQQYEWQIAANPARWGDVVLVRKDTPTSYHLSVVVDDAAQGVTHVTRGMDLEAATDIHVLLQELLGLPSPFYAHHDLVLDEERQKLSKSKGSQSLRDLRAAGWTAGEVRRRLGFE